MKTHKLYFSRNSETKRNQTVQTQKSLAFFRFIQSVTIPTTQGAAIPQQQNSPHKQQMQFNTPGRKGMKYQYNTFWGGYNLCGTAWQETCYTDLSRKRIKVQTVTQKALGHNICLSCSEGLVDCIYV
jgi:hypothetical protein